MSSDPTAAPVATPVQTRAMRQAVWVQCLGTLTFQALQGGVVLLYLKAMEVSNISIDRKSVV